MGLYFETIRLAAVEERRGTVTPGHPLRWLAVSQVVFRQEGDSGMEAMLSQDTEQQKQQVLPRG